MKRPTGLEFAPVGVNHVCVAPTLQFPGLQVYNSQRTTLQLQWTLCTVTRTPRICTSHNSSLRCTASNTSNAAEASPEATGCPATGAQYSAALSLLLVTLCTAHGAVPGHHVLAHVPFHGELLPTDRTLRLPAVFLHVLKERAVVAVVGAADMAAEVARLSS